MTIVPPRTNGLAQIDTGAGTTEYGGVTTTSHNLGTQTAADDSGSVYDDTRSIVSQTPTMTISTKDWVRLLNDIGIGGLCLQDPNRFNVFHELHAQCTPRAAGASHTRYQIANGLLIPDTLTADIGQDSVMSFMAHGISVGGNAPISSTYSASLPTAIVTEQHTLGVCKLEITGVNSVAVEETVSIVMENITGVQVSFNIEVRKRGGPGTVWPLWVSVAKIRPTVRIRSVDLTLWNDVSPIKIPTLGGAANHTTGAGGTPAKTLLQFIRKKPGSTYFPFASAVHYGISVSGIAYITQAASASGQGDSELELVIESTYDGTYAPIILYPDKAYEASP